MPVLKSFAPRVICAMMLGAAALAVSACENKSKPNPAAVDRAKLCSEGGATLDATSNECVCSAGMHWAGARCEAAAPPPPETASDGAALKPADEASGSGAQAVDVASGSGGASEAEALPPPDEKLKAACHAAGAGWDAAHGYCLCKGDAVLVGLKCVALAGKVTDDACMHAVHAGKWKKGDCSCPEGAFFAPNLGGCVALRSFDQVLARRLCESSANGGKWDAHADRCACSKERIWSTGRCLAQREMSSKQVCESEFNHGTWDKAKKSCGCPDGKAWRDQRCRLLTTLDPKTACESEAVGGKWEAGVSRCLCPKKMKWDQKTLSCQ